MTRVYDAHKRPRHGIRARLRVGPVGVLLSSLVCAAACDRPKPAAEKPALDAALAPKDAGRPPVDARRTAAPVPSGPPKRLFASRYVARIRAAPKKEAVKLGYMRAGAIVMSRNAEPISHEKCRKGWFELARGGFVCSTQDVIPFLGRRLPERRPLQPDLSARLPYPYGYSRFKNTPVYRRLPTAAEADSIESPARAAPSGDASTPDDAGLSASGAPGAGDALDGGVPTLESLMGDRDSVLLRRMERGFYVSLDHEMERDGRAYYRTQANGFIPKRRLFVVKGSDFAGMELSEGGQVLPLGYLMSSKYVAYKLDERGRLRRAGKPGYHHRFAIVGETEIRGRPYYVADGGMHYRVRDTAKIEARAPPAEVGPEEKWLDVDLAAQTLVAYVGARPVYATLVSTGRVKHRSDPKRNFETPSGAFRINAKHLTTTMEGDHAIDGPYSIEDVPYVMFFYQGGYALHSAFWHNSFGRPRSHGCVNLAPADARWVFNWVEPRLPESWHGVYTQEDSPGTRVYVRGETPEG